MVIVRPDLNRRPQTKKRTRRNPEGRGGNQTLVTGGWRNVVLGGRAVNVTNPYWRYNDDYTLDHHTGVDFSAGSGTPINAPLEGKVVEVSSGGAYGNTVVVRLEDGYYMRFAHMSSVNVSNGQRIRAGQFVGKVGSTGFSSGAHLHLEVMKPSSKGKFGGGNFVNPMDYLNGRKTQVVRDKQTYRDEPKGSDAQTLEQGLSGPNGFTTTDSGTDLGGMTMAKFSKKEMYAMLSNKFGSIDALLAMDKAARDELGGKSIRWAINKIVKEKQVNGAVMLTYLNQTAWFKKYSNEMTERLILEKDKPELASGEVDKKRASIKATLDAYGVQISDGALTKMARDAWAYGWTDETVIDKIQERDDLSFSGGSIAAGVDNLEMYANQYGVNLTDADIQQFRQDEIDGRGDINVRDTIQQRAAQTYSIFADQILAGQSTRSLTGAYWDKAAQLLETDPDSIDWDDPLFNGGKAWTATDANGKQVQKGLWDFEKEIRKDARWIETQNARDEVYGTATGVLKTMGLI